MQLLSLFISLLVITRSYCLDVTELAVKVCTASDVDIGASCIASDSSLMQQTYNFSTAANTDILVRPFSFTDDAEVTTSQVNNRIVFECSGSNPVSEILSDVIPELSRSVEFVNKFSSSCLEVLTKNSSAESGYYKLRLSNGTVIDAYCDMVGTDCEEIGGWTRVGYFNMAEAGSDSCPSPLVGRDYSELDYPLCQRVSYWGGCDSFYYDNLGIEYESVCGRALGYQFGSPDGLQWSWYNVDDNYVDGLSITYESPRKHIWTYVAGVYPDSTNHESCPCNHNNNIFPPSFLGNNYYCESGGDPGTAWTAELHASDKLWDGQECETNEAGCCPSGNTLPWFSRLLSSSTNSDIELRLCDDESEDNERVPIEMVEIFIR